MRSTRKFEIHVSPLTCNCSSTKHQGFILAASGSASVEASDLIESNYCNLTSEAGNIEAAKIKTGHLTLQSTTGDVLCLGHLQARTVIKTQSGNVIADKRFTGEVSSSSVTKETCCRIVNTNKAMKFAQSTYLGHREFPIIRDRNLTLEAMCNC